MTLRSLSSSSSLSCSGSRRALFGGVFALALLTGVTAAPEARAQDAQAQAMGRSLFNDGVALFNRGDYEGACPKFEASLKAYPGIGTRGKLAECYEKLGRYASAFTAYREVAALAQKSGDAAREQVATARAKALEPKLARLTISLAPGVDPTGMVIRRGNVEVDRSKLGTSEPIDAGALVVEATAPGKKPFSVQLTATAGQTSKVEIQALQPLEGRPTVPPPVAVTPAPAPPPASADALGTYPVDTHESGGWHTPVGLTVLGAGVVAIGVGAYFGLTAKSKYDDAFDSGACDRGTNQCTSGGQSAVDDARSKATVSTILFAAGGAASVAGLIVLLTGPSSSHHGLNLAPTMVAGGGGLSLSGRL
ncbi:MAG: hypothetical protein JWP97_2354 [Labilithrix sp.]|nr:hypothetical protein [Labilithrix sp.]